jgi:hypothetical protein
MSYGLLVVCSTFALASRLFSLPMAILVAISCDFALMDEPLAYVGLSSIGNVLEMVDYVLM